MTMAPAAGNSHRGSFPLLAKQSSSTQERNRHLQQQQQQHKRPQPSPNSKQGHGSSSQSPTRGRQPLERSGSFPQAERRSSSFDQSSRRKRNGNEKTNDERRQRDHSAHRESPRLGGKSEKSTFLAHGQYGLGTSDASSQGQASSSYSEDLSSYSAQSAPMPQKLTIDYTDYRDPSPISLASQKREFTRDASPDRSQESDKQYIRTTRRIIEDLSRAQGTARRVAAVTSACEAFDHHDEARHNIELAHGSVQALAKMLEQTRTTDDELRMICSALEMVFRGNPKSVRDAFKKTSSGFLPRLLLVLERCEERGVKHADISILNITKIIFYLSKCPDLRVPLCRQMDVLEFLARVATQVLNPDCRALRLKVIANLATADKNKIVLHSFKAILDGILRIGHMDTFDLARQHAAVALQEMASCSHNHVAMANNPQLLGVLVKMALVEKSHVTRDAVVSAMQALAFTKKNRVRLVNFKDGVVLEALKRTLSVDPDDKIRRRAAGTLTNLACDETAEAMGSHKGLLEALAIISTKDYNSDVQNRAALALTKIGSSINNEMSCFNTLLDALVVASLSDTSNSVAAVLRLKAREPQNRVAIANHAGVLDTLADTCVSLSSSPTDRENALRALMHLVNEDQNKKSLCNKNILHALVTGANMDDGDSRASAIRGLERLATEADNRPVMARHSGLLQAVARATEREVKLQDSKVESEHGYLAKPLLMSLLLAM